MKTTLMALAAASLALPFAASPLLASPSATVHYDDLDLDAPAGKTELDKRIAKAAQPVCRDVIVTGTLLSQELCHSQIRNSVRAEIALREERSGKGG